MGYEKEKLQEKILIFLYVIYHTSKSININTFKRYLYLYYFTSSFFNKNTEDIKIILNKGDIKITYFEEAIEDFIMNEYLYENENSFVVNDVLVDSVSHILEGKDGEKGSLFSLYREINPFVNLLNSYDDQLIFTIFFSEPTFREAHERNLEKINSSSSILVKLLNRFKESIENKNIDDYDILTYWMDFILKNYYKNR